MAALLIPNLLVGNQRKAVAYMLLAVTFFSSLPLIIAWGGGGQAPFLFNAGMSGGMALGCLLFVAAFYRRLLFNWDSLRLIRKRMFNIYIALSIVANFNFAVFAWSTRFVDVSITAILFETWPIFIILIMERLFRSQTLNRRPTDITSVDADSDQEPPRYHRLTPGMFLIMLLGVAGFGFVVVGQAGGFAGVQASSLLVAIIGVVLAVVGAITTAFAAFSFRWGTDIVRELPESATQGTSKDSQELFGLLIAFLIANSVSAVLNLFLGSASGETMDSRSLLIAVALGGAVNGAANVAWRKANLSTQNLGINAVSFATPIFSLAWLFLLYQVAPARPDYLLAGAVGIVIVNLVINLEAEIRLGFKALVLALWAFGAFVYLRDDVLKYLPFGEWHWPGETYFGSLGLAATVFILLHSFRVNRISTRTQEEDNHVYTLFHSLDLLVRRNVVDESIRERILALDKSVTPEQLQTAYQDAKQCLDEAMDAAPTPEDEADLANAEAQLNVIVHSRQQGIDFGELFALIIFGGVTVLLGLGARPEVSGWIGFLVEMLVMLFSAVIVFLIVNVWDLHRDRAGEVLAKQEVYDGYGVVFREAADRRFEQITSITIGLLVTIAYAVLLWFKWTG